MKEHAFGHLAIKLSTNIVAALFTFILVLLAFMSIISTCFMEYTTGSAEGEHTFFLGDNVALNLAIMVVLFIAAYLLSSTQPLQSFRNRLADDRFFKRCKLVILGFLCLLACIWVAATMAIPGADQQAVQAAVIMAKRGDWSLFAPSEYMGRFPHQYGLFWISMLFALVFGKYTSAFFQVFNIVGILVVCWSLGKIACHMKASRLQQLATMLLCIACYPLIQYCTFVYGTMWGLALALLAISFEMDFFSRGLVRHAVLAGTCIALSILFKSNYTIFFIGMVLYAALEALKTRSARKGLVVVVMAVGLAIVSLAPSAAVGVASGQPASTGMSSWGWIAMGMQDGPRAPGWFNSYTRRSYEEAEFDTETHAAIAKENARQSFQEFLSGERDASDFYLKKIASQWNNPTFQGSWIMQGSRAAFQVLPPVEAFLNAQGTDTSIRWYLNPLHLLILSGALAWILLRKWDDREFYKDLVLPVIFLGGFLCHLIWEGKCQYVFPYYVLLFPYAAMGFALFATKVKRAMDGNARKKGDSSPKLPLQIGPALSLTISLALVAALMINGGYSSLTGDEQEYFSWMESNPECSYLSQEPFLAEALSFAD